MSRLTVVFFLFGAWASTFVSDFLKRYVRHLFRAGMWIITLHYYYLFYGNSGDPNWVVGTYITVIAISFGFFSGMALLLYSIYVFLLSIGIVILDRSLVGSVFLPGLLTMLFQANIGLRSRLNLIKDLKASNERFQTLFNSTFEGVLVHQDQKIVDANTAVLKMFDYTREEIVGRSIFDFIHPENRKTEMDKLRFADMAPYETVGVTKHGRAINIEVRGKDFEIGNHPTRIVTIQDISDRKLAEKERIIAMTLAENVRLRDDFISIASHELKTPLTALQLQVQLIERDLKKRPSEEQLIEIVHSSTQFLRRQITRITELVESMIDVSRISSGRFIMHKEKFDISTLVREIAGSLVALHTEPPVTIEIDALMPITLEGDRQRLGQVIENLLSNAIKYGNQKPIAIRARRQGPNACITVEDKGIGIAPEFIAKIFDRFERAVSARNITGFGLGLFIAREIVHAHGGTIEIKSTLGVGSTFTVTLPAD